MSKPLEVNSSPARIIKSQSQELDCVSELAKLAKWTGFDSFQTRVSTLIPHCLADLMLCRLKANSLGSSLDWHWTIIWSVGKYGLDAMKFSKPILTSIPGFAANFVTNKGIGIVYSNEKISSLLEIFRDLSSDHDKIFNMAKNSGTTFENLFTYDKVYGQLVEKLGQMIHRK